MIILQIVSASVMLVWAVYCLAADKDGLVGKAIYFLSAALCAAMLWPASMAPYVVEMRHMTLDATCASLIVYHNTLRIYRKCHA